MKSEILIEVRMQAEEERVTETGLGFASLPIMEEHSWVGRGRQVFHLNFFAHKIITHLRKIDK